MLYEVITKGAKTYNEGKVNEGLISHDYTEQDYADILNAMEEM